MHFKQTVVVVATIALAACGQPKVNETNASGNKVAEAVDSAGGADMHLAAGRWEATSVLTEMKVAGLPPEVAQAMRAAVGEKDTSASCLTQKDVEKPGASFFAKNNDCTYEHFTMGSGRLDAKMICEEKGSKTTIKLGGTYSTNSYDMAMESATAGGEQNGMTMKMTVKGAHVGACRGDETSA